jgi:hypothetical protein
LLGNDLVKIWKKKFQMLFYTTSVKKFKNVFPLNMLLIGGTSTDKNKISEKLFELLQNSI